MLACELMLVRTGWAESAAAVVGTSAIPAAVPCAVPVHFVWAKTAGAIGGAVAVFTVVAVRIVLVRFGRAQIAGTKRAAPTVATSAHHILR